MGNTNPAGCDVALTTPEDRYFASQPVSSDGLGLSHRNDTGKIIHELLGETRVIVSILLVV